MLQTDDLFLGAFGLLRGGELREVLVRGMNGKRNAVFLIDGPDIEDVEREYYRGPSLVNLRLFKSEVARLKSIAFEALRQEHPQAGPPFRPSGIHSHKGGKTRTRPAEDANVDANGVASREEESRNADSNYEGRDRAYQGVEPARRYRL